MINSNIDIKFETDPVKSAEMLAKAKTLFSEGLDNITKNGVEPLVSSEEAYKIRSGMTEADNMLFEAYMDQETVRQHSEMLDKNNVSVKLRTAMEAFIEDSFLRVTMKPGVSSETRKQVINDLSISDTIIMKQFIDSEVAECIIRDKIRAHGLDPVIIMKQFIAMEAKNSGGVSIN